MRQRSNTSAPTGSVEILGHVQDGQVMMVWTEKGGPALTVPSERTGFGSKLVHTSITGQLGGTITFDWPTDGAIVTLRVSKALLGA